MQVPHGAGKFTFPNPPAPTSPPTTPESSTRSRHPSATGFTPPLRPKRNGIVGLNFTPPEHIEPVNGHNFSYIPSERDPSSSESSESAGLEAMIGVNNDDSDDDDDGDDGDVEDDDTENNSIDLDDSEDDFNEAVDSDREHSLVLESQSDSESDSESEAEVAGSRRSSPARPVNVADFTVVDITEHDDMEYDTDTEVLHPSYYESAPSESGHRENAGPAKPLKPVDLAEPAGLEPEFMDNFESLKCCSREEQQEKEREFEEAQNAKLLRRRKRWSKGGSHKRNITQSIGSNSEDNEDITPLDAQEVGCSARRLRRRTQGPDERPRKSLIFDDAPREIEELRWMGEHGEVLVAAESQSDGDSDGVILPPWMYMSMDIDTEPSRTSSSRKMALRV